MVELTSNEKRAPIGGGALFLFATAHTKYIQAHAEHIPNVFKRIQDAYFQENHFPKSEHEKPNRHSLFHHFFCKVGFGFLMLFFILAF